MIARLRGRGTVGSRAWVSYTTWVGWQARWLRRRWRRGGAALDGCTIQPFAGGAGGRFGGRRALRGGADRAARRRPAPAGGGGADLSVVRPGDDRALDRGQRSHRRDRPAAGPPLV